MLEQLRAFIETPLSMTVGSRDAELQPHFARASAFRLGPAADEATVFVSSVLADEIVRDLRANGRIAVTMTNLDNLQARQVKGTMSSVSEATAADVPRIRAMRALAHERLVRMNGEAVGALILRIPEQPMLAIVFTVAEVFDQTPRPGAGARLS